MTTMLKEVQKKGIQEIWIHSSITPLFKQKRDSLNCNNYRGIKLLSHLLKLWERVIEHRLREIVTISERQYGFQKGKSTTQPMFCLRMVQERFRVFDKSIHIVLVDTVTRILYGSVCVESQCLRSMSVSFRICIVEARLKLQQ